MIGFAMDKDNNKYLGVNKLVVVFNNENIFL